MSKAYRAGRIRQVSYNGAGGESEDLIKNVGSLNDDIEKLIAENKLAIDHVEIERSKITEAGEYDLEGLFVRLGFAIESVGAKRVVVNTTETLFSGLENEQLLRSELRRLFEWLKAKGVTAIITGERGEGALTRRGLEEYVADCRPARSAPSIKSASESTGSVELRQLACVFLQGASRRGLNGGRNGLEPHRRELETGERKGQRKMGRINRRRP
jgi:KaiC